MIICSTRFFFPQEIAFFLQKKVRNWSKYGISNFGMCWQYHLFIVKLACHPTSSPSPIGLLPTIKNNTILYLKERGGPKIGNNERYKESHFLLLKAWMKSQVYMALLSNNRAGPSGSWGTSFQGIVTVTEGATLGILIDCIV